MPFFADALAQNRENARLSDPRFAGEQCDLALSGAGVAPALDKKRDLGFAADEGYHALRPCGLKPAHVFLFAHDRENLRRGRKPSELLLAEVFQFECAAEQAARRIGDQHPARLCERLQPRSEIGRFSNHRLFLSRSLTDEVADHDPPGRDADSHRERLVGAGLKPRHERRDFETCPNRLFRVVFVRAWKTEIGEDAVAHELGDKAVVTRHDPRTGVLVDADDLARVLGIEPRRKRGRAGEIAEHDGELPALGGGRNALRRRLALGDRTRASGGVRRGVRQALRSRS